MNFFKGFVVSVLVLVALNCSAKTSSMHDLGKVTKAIQHIKKSLATNYRQVSVVQKALEKNEVERAHVVVLSHKTTSKIVQKKASLKVLKKKSLNYQQQLTLHQTELAKQMRAMYILGNRPYIKFLLNQEDLKKINRMLVYYRYVEKYKITLMRQIANNIWQVHKTKKSITHQTKQLEYLLAGQRQQAQKLQVLATTRKVLLQKTKATIRSEQAKLQMLMAEKMALEKYIAQLQQQAAKTPMQQLAPKWQNGFAWPAAGSVEELFGESIDHSQLTWDGDLIDAPLGTKVHSVAKGKVVFAQWLQGYGLLLIVDHHNGYMSLYGRNNVLYKKVGDAVSKGDVVADVGNSGGFASPSLYFAIRYNGKPINPRLWCKT